MNKNLIYSLLVAVVLLGGCQDFLEPKSQSEYVPKVIQSLDELLLGDAYLSPLSITSNLLYSSLGLFDDDVAAREDLTIKEESESVLNQVLLAFSWSQDMSNKLSGYGNAYASSYRLILGCNAVLDYLDDVTGTVDGDAYRHLPQELPCHRCRIGDGNRLGTAHRRNQLLT